MFLFWRLLPGPSKVLLAPSEGLCIILSDQLLHSDRLHGKPSECYKQEFISAFYSLRLLNELLNQRQYCVGYHVDRSNTKIKDKTRGGIKIEGIGGEERPLRIMQRIIQERRVFKKRSGQKSSIKSEKCLLYLTIIKSLEILEQF